MTLAQFGAVLLAALLIAVSIAWTIGPARLLANLAAGLVVVPVLWAIVTAAALGAWAALRFHGVG